MPNINLCVLGGHLTRAPELKYAASGTAIAHFGLAVNNRRKEQGEWKTVPLFLDVTCFAKTAEYANEYLSKGDPALVQGRIEMDSWVGQDGEKRTKLCLVADRVDSLVVRGERRVRDENAQEHPPEVSQERPADEAPF